MTWFKVDDGLSDHPKIRSIPRSRRAAAVGLWTLAGSWSSRHLTEGIVPGYMVIDLGCTKAQADALVDAGLWHRTAHDCHQCPKVPAGSYLFHAWAERNPTRSQVEKDREASAERQRRARDKRRARAEAEASASLAQGEREPHASRGQAEAEPHSDAGHDGWQPADLQEPDNVTDMSRRDALAASQCPDPTRPDPTRTYIQDDTHTPPTATRETGRPDDPKGMDGHPRHRYHQNAKAVAQRWETERKLPITAAELIAWMYRIGEGDPWHGRLLVDQVTMAQLDTATNPTRALRARLREAAGRNRQPETPPFGLTIAGVS